MKRATPVHVAHAAWRHRHSMAVLLAMLAVVIFVVPVVAPPLGDSGRAVIEVFFLVVLLSGAWTIAEHRVAAVVVVGLCVAMMIGAWLVPQHGGIAAPLARQVATLAAVLVLAAATAARVFAAGRITTDRIMGAVALYLALGVAWGNAYEIVALLDSGAFNGGVQGVHGVERWYYFSFVTLTTVGYGDVTPVARAAQSLAIAEALVGQLYPAIILARLVTLQTSAPPDDPPPP